MTRNSTTHSGTAFVLGGGGMLGAVEVGMLRGLIGCGIHPGLVIGTSVGAINGAVMASDPSMDAVDRLEELWTSLSSDHVFAGSTLRRVGTFARTRTHVHSPEPLERLLIQEFRDRRIEDLPVAFECVAASIEKAAEHWFTSGPLVPAVLASCAVPGLLPPVKVGDEHFLDGGLVDSIPVGRAFTHRPRTVFVLQVGRIERPLEPPTRAWEVAMVAFEIARRHRFSTTLAATPPDVAVHVLPTGDVEPPRYADLSVLRYRDNSRIADRIRRAEEATRHYLEEMNVQPESSEDREG